jgi:TM2 domain-containing membrane protein YozV
VEPNIQPTSTHKVCPSCSQSANLNAAFCAACGHQYSTQFVQPTPSGAPTQAFYGAKPAHLQEANSKKLAAGICGILLNCFGVHKFILGYTSAGLIMLLGSILTCGIAAPVFSIIGLVEGIMYLTKSDDEFYVRYIAGRQEWF